MPQTNEVTRTALIAFVKENAGRLFVRVDAVSTAENECSPRLEYGFHPATRDTGRRAAIDTLGIAGVVLAGEGQDYFFDFDEKGFQGILVVNSQTAFVLAVKT